MPEQWLSCVLEEIKSCDPSSTLCATRRSAGIPFYIQVPTHVTASDLNVFSRKDIRKKKITYLFFPLQPLLTKKLFFFLFFIHTLPLCNQEAVCN